MSRYHGRRGVIYASTSGTGNATQVIALTDWSIDRSTDTVEMTALLDTNKVYSQGLPDVSGTFNGFYDDTDTKVITGADSTDGVKLYVYPSADAATKYAYGPAWLSYSISGGVGDAVKISAKFSANGAWGFKL
jgi:hypothetical protein